MPIKEVYKRKRINEILNQIQNRKITCDNCIALSQCNQYCYYKKYHNEDMCAKHIYEKECLLCVSKYEGKSSNDFDILFGVEFSDKGLILSKNNRNFYRGFDGDILFSEPDDDNRIKWFLCDNHFYLRRLYFGESLIENDTIHVFNLE